MRNDVFAVSFFFVVDVDLLSLSLSSFFLSRLENYSRFFSLSTFRQNNHLLATAAAFSANFSPRAFFASCALRTDS